MKKATLSDKGIRTLAALALAPMPRQEINPGLARKLLLEALAEEIVLPSPYRTVKGDVLYLRITGAGLARLPIPVPRFKDDRIVATLSMRRSVWSSIADGGDTHLTACAAAQCVIEGRSHYAITAALSPGRQPALLRLLVEARANVQASIADTGISDDQRSQRRSLYDRLHDTIERARKGGRR